MFECTLTIQKFAKYLKICKCQHFTNLSGLRRTSPTGVVISVSFFRMPKEKICPTRTHWPMEGEMEGSAQSYWSYESKKKFKKPKWRHTHSRHFSYVRPGNANSRDRMSTVGLLVITSLDQLLLTLTNLFYFLRNKILNEEVNCTKPSPSVRRPWSGDHLKTLLYPYFDNIIYFSLH
jgi:hypothetical protein